MSSSSERSLDFRKAKAPVTLGRAYPLPQERLTAKRTPVFARPSHATPSINPRLLTSLTPHMKAMDPRRTAPSLDVPHRMGLRTAKEGGKGKGKKKTGK